VTKAPDAASGELPVLGRFSDLLGHEVLPGAEDLRAGRSRIETFAHRAPDRLEFGERQEELCEVPPVGTPLGASLARLEGKDLLGDQLRGFDDEDTFDGARPGERRLGPHVHQMAVLRLAHLVDAEALALGYLADSNRDLEKLRKMGAQLLRKLRCARSGTPKPCSQAARYTQVIIGGLE